jgi:hypothetical protein
MQVHYDLTYRDFAAAQRLHAKRTTFSYITYCAGRYIYPVIGVCILAFEFSRYFTVGSAQPKLFSSLCGIALVCMPLYLHFMLKRCYKRSRTQAGECLIEFNEEMIRTKISHSKSEVGWGAIQSFSEDKSTILQYLAPLRFLAVPLRVCTDEQADELRLLLQRHVKGSDL